ncbi:ComF family protein [Candidatus Saccharibacteria bacterium]|nr:ComF family protein [Candidatus Saccharibacteria bacterium]
MPIIVKNTTFPGLFSLLAPHSCRGCGHLGEPLCDRCKNYIIKHNQNVCPICRSKNPTGLCSNCPNSPLTFVAGNRSDLIGDLIHDLKYDSVRSLARPLAEIMNSCLPPTKKSIIIPLPTISRHIRERGFDHTYLIAKHLARLRPDCHVSRLLVRAKNTVQVGSDSSTRKTQAASAYTLNPKAKIDPSATYIIFDDVWTTGASAQTACQLLQKAGTKNIILTILARS